ncbi:Metallo-dependent phosphatase [Rhizoclosmatium globosum]|uniref:Metallo-dependent phosphatase n=1 Tax=Rhizoclosmatium globosum TaxID=329046 RepID=A0A1Y2BBV5_9FUNG|nr:Metallo-dependent phosphatase [Rhizoclosmatium globosum]|eukprot:ORY31575.1 Metallo-dependent phosphatase [Rhizoclosmatium globosum]
MGKIIRANTSAGERRTSEATSTLSRDSNPNTPLSTTVFRLIKSIWSNPDLNAVPTHQIKFLTVNDVYKMTNLPSLATAIQEEKAKGVPVIVLLPGDFISPSLLSSLDRGFGMIDVLNQVGIDYVCFGNHEDDVDFQALLSRLKQSQFKWVNTNMKGFPLPEDLVEQAPTFVQIDVPALDLKSKAKKVALLGLCTDDEHLYKPRHFGGATLEPVNATAIKFATTEKNYDLIVPMTHQDIGLDRHLASTGLFPVVVGGHEHEPFLETWNGSQVIKTGLDANQFSIVHVKWFSGNPKPKVTIELKDTDKYAPKPDVLEAVNKHMRAVDLLKTSVLCQIPSNIILSSRHVRRRPCTMGIFLCSIIRDAVNAECCIINAGTFRGNKKYVDVKDFTYMDLEAEMPYASEIAQYKLPGRLIQEVIAFTRAPALQNPPVEKGGFMQSCDRIKWDPATNTVVSIGGEPLDMDRMYSTAISYQAVAGLDNITPLLKYFNVDPAAPQANGHQDFDYIGAKELIVSHFCLSLWHDMLLSESFESMDKDNLGYITKDEVFEAVKKHYQGDHALSTVVVDNLFSMADVSGDGKISRKEFFGLKLFVMEEIDFNGRDQDDAAEVVLTPEIIAVEAEYEKEVAREIVSSVEGTREIKLDATVDVNGNQRLSVEELKKFVKEEVKKVGHAVSLLGGAAEE